MGAAEEEAAAGNGPFDRHGWRGEAGDGGGGRGRSHERRQQKGCEDAVLGGLRAAAPAAEEIGDREGEGGRSCL